jgi:hypothetical protein
MKRAIQGFFDFLVGRVPGGQVIAVGIVIAAGIAAVCAIWFGLDLFPVWALRLALMWLTMYAIGAHMELSERGNRGERDGL